VARAERHTIIQFKATRQTTAFDTYRDAPDVVQSRLLLFSVLESLHGLETRNIARAVARRIEGRVVAVTIVAFETPVCLTPRIPPEPVLPLSVEQYHEMIQAGILENGAPFELLEGWLVKKTTKDPPHTLSLGCTFDALSDLVGPGWHVRKEDPITTDDSEPEPDVSVVRGRRRDYADRHPAPSDTGLLVEVADASLDRDRGWKKRLYASAGIPVFWIVNLAERQVEVFTHPSGRCQRPDYAVQEVYQAGQAVPVVLDGQRQGQIAVDDLLP
jgi:Uma2 family endonuclease